MMSTIEYRLYIDESGEFDDRNLSASKNPSLVGGLLCGGALTGDVLELLVTHNIHGCEKYIQAEYLPLLRKLREMGGQFVIFENSERIHVIDGDVTYINIISEGLVRLMRELAADHPGDALRLSVLIANRVNVDRKQRTGITILIDPEDYRARLEEKLVLAMGRAGVTGVAYDLNFASARRDKKLMLADIVCNTYLTRKAKGKFTKEERELIAGLYEGMRIYPVFENATVGYLNRLLIDRRYGEMAYQLCALPSLGAALPLRDKLLRRIGKMSPAERYHLFSGVSSQIAILNSRALYQAGIGFALNYKAYLLDRLPDCGVDAKTVGRWRFDTDFFLLMMYEHIGDTAKCGEYMELCREELKAIPYSLENLDYHYKYRIRELNCLMGRFDFETVLEKCGEMEKLFGSIADVFEMIDGYEGQTSLTRSDLLAKVYGIRMVALMNLGMKKPELLDEALEVSDKAIAEFTYEYDTRRQYQSRSLLHVLRGEGDAALEYLAGSFGDPAVSFEAYIERAYARHEQPDLFAVFHYTNVMLLLKRQGDVRADDMYKALTAHPEFREAERKGLEAREYPYCVILWNISRYLELCGEGEKSKKYFRAALDPVKLDGSRQTYVSFGVSMAAERLLTCMRKHTDEKEARADLVKAVKVFTANPMPQSMADWYGDLSEPNKMNETRLAELSRLYQK